MQELHVDISYYIILNVSYWPNQWGFEFNLDSLGFSLTEFYMKAAEPLKLAKSESMISELFNNIILVCSWYNVYLNKYIKRTRCNAHKKYESI